MSIRKSRKQVSKCPKAPNLLVGLRTVLRNLMICGIIYSNLSHKNWNPREQEKSAKAPATEKGRNFPKANTSVSRVTLWSA